MHEFASDFYGDDIRIIVTGYIRPEQNYPSLGKLKRENKCKCDGYNMYTHVSLVYFTQMPLSVILKPI